MVFTAMFLLEALVCFGQQFFGLLNGALVNCSAWFTWRVSEEVDTFDPCSILVLVKVALNLHSNRYLISMLPVSSCGQLHRRPQSVD
jgi:hypothetical protein